ncbi:MAG TPA: hypothetical protein VGH92_08930 [Gaiellaceae bacterium]
MKRLALFIVAVVVLAGCGGSSRLSKTAYEQKLQVDGAQVQASITKLVKNPPTTLAQVATRIDRTEAIVQQAANEIASLKAPSDAVADNAAIVTGLRRIQSGLEQVKKNPTAAASVITSIEKSPQLKAATKATTDLKRKGYKVGVIGAP